MLFPVKTDDKKQSKGYLSKSTPIYQDKTTVIFNLDQKYNDASNYKFEFNLGDDVEHRTDGPFTQYVEINSYQISSKKVWKNFRGHVLIPITDQVPKFDKIEDFEELCQFAGQGAEGKFVSPKNTSFINEGESKSKSTLLNNLFDELKTRKEAKYYAKHREAQFLNCKTTNKLKQ